jgi:hypothetical protein
VSNPFEDPLGLRKSQPPSAGATGRPLTSSAEQASAEQAADEEAARIAEAAAAEEAALKERVRRAKEAEARETAIEEWLRAEASFWEELAPRLEDAPTPAWDAVWHTVVRRAVAQQIAREEVAADVAAARVRHAHEEALAQAAEEQRRKEQFISRVRMEYNQTLDRYKKIFAPFSDSEELHHQVLSRCGLAQQSKSRRVGPDGSTTELIDQYVPDLVHISVVRTGLRLVFRPLLGQRAADFETAIASLAPALGTSATRWTVDSGDDGTISLIYTDRKLQFPAVLLPRVEDVFVAHDHSAAVDHAVSRRMRITIGRTIDGEPIVLSPGTMPHTFLVAKTGGGKSALLAWLIENWRCAGAEVHIADGKAAGEFRGMVAAEPPGVCSLATDPHSFVRLIEHVSQLMEYRQANSPGGSNYPGHPIVLVLDELAQIRIEAAAWLAAHADDPTKAKNDFDAKLNKILRLGRSMKVHLIMTGQELYDSTLKVKDRNNVNIVILGKLIDTVIDQSFGKAGPSKDIKQAMNNIPDDAPMGRGTLVRGDEVVSYKTVYSYYPGVDWDDPGSPQTTDPAVRRNWKTFKAHVSDNVPIMYPRIWFKVDALPSDVSYWGDLSYGELTQLPVITLSDESGKTIPDKQKYSPHDPAYVGHPKSGRGYSPVVFGN